MANLAVLVLLYCCNVEFLDPQAKELMFSLVQALHWQDRAEDKILPYHISCILTSNHTGGRAGFSLNRATWEHESQSPGCSHSLTIWTWQRAVRSPNCVMDKRNPVSLDYPSECYSTRSAARTENWALFAQQVSQTFYHTTWRKTTTDGFEILHVYVD